MMYQGLTKVLQFFPPEMAHHLAINLLRFFPVANILNHIATNELSQEWLGMNFIHPLGLAAGFDKHAEVYSQLGKLGFSFVEVGSITPKSQPGNPKPRLFRLKEVSAIINRYGFNSKGIDYAIQQLKCYPKTCITGINLGVNKDTCDPISDFVTGTEALAPYANYFTINVSSPNTPGLRDMQRPEVLMPIITRVRDVGKQQGRKLPLFIKLSPDLAIEQEKTLVEFIIESSIDGIIISNTTVSREGTEGSKFAYENGGLSGVPLKNRSMAMLRRIYSITQGKLLLISSGGITNGQDAYARLRAGANLLQIYTAFIYQGPLVIQRILLELKALLAKDNIKNIQEIIGIEHYQ